MKNSGLWMSLFSSLVLLFVGVESLTAYNGGMLGLSRAAGMGLILVGFVFAFLALRTLWFGRVKPKKDDDPDQPVKFR